MFVKELEILENLEYKIPLDKSDHILHEFRLKSGSEEVRNEDYKDRRYNYSKTNFVELWKYFEKADWTDFIYQRKLQIKGEF